MTERTTAAELLVVGGGVIALSIAYHCARAGIDVVLLDPDPPGGGAAEATTRPVRTYQPGKVHNSELTVRGLADYRAFEPAGGADLVLADVGWLVVLTNRDQASELERELAAQRDAGVEVELLTAAQACAHNPWLDPAGVEAALWCPQSSLLDVAKVVRGYADGAREHGARLLAGRPVTALDATTGRVSTLAGEFSAEAIVLAAGAATGELAAAAGVDLPLWGQLAELFRTDPVPAGEAPFTVHPESGLKTLGAGQAFMIGLERISRQAGMRDVWFEETVAEVAKRYPRLKDVRLHSAWTGSVDVTPDRTALIGRAGERLFVAAGYTGQDLGQAPATGRILRDLYLGRSPGVDLAPFSPAPISS
ncbi:MAG: FAD-binding oxidoreductase [Umezawaea sp.]